MSGPLTPVTVLEDWTATYADAIRVGDGEAVVLDGHRDTWDDHVWLWARAADGREGWLPDTLLVADADGWRTTGAFDARELTCRAGDGLTRLDATHAWALCRTKDGRQGWVPQRNLATPTPTPTPTPTSTRKATLAPPAPIRATGASR